MSCITLRLRKSKKTHAKIQAWVNNLEVSEKGYNLELNHHVENALIQYIESNDWTEITPKEESTEPLKKTVKRSVATSFIKRTPEANVDEPFHDIELDMAIEPIKQVAKDENDRFKRAMKDMNFTHE